MLHMRKNKNNYYLKVFYTEPFPEDLSTCKAYDQHNMATHVALFARLLQVIFLFGLFSGLLAEFIRKFQIVVMIFIRVHTSH